MNKTAAIPYPSPQTAGLARWLFICAAAVFLMALIGAVTRLTESGLSIVRWEPVMGAVPPLTAADWQREFDLYRESPQYQKINRGMSLSEFKEIYFWEWVHRQWGRVIGLIYALPLVWFWLRGKIPAETKPALLGVLLLGAAQGAMGWYMVKSGLVDQPAVSHYRLAAHLMLAFLIYACLFRLGLGFSLRPEKEAGMVTALRPAVWRVLVPAVLAMAWGAFVAGLRAGLLYNTFPTMDGHWFPPEMLAHAPVWLAFVQEPATVQFTHRVLGLLTFVAIVALWWKSRAYNPPVRVKQLVGALVLTGLAQVTLGVVTLLSQVHIVPAVMHQGGALLVLTLLVWLLYEIPSIRAQK